jgi:hypothetical protein
MPPRYGSEADTVEARSASPDSQHAVPLQPFAVPPTRGRSVNEIGFAVSDALIT